jgi:hypothetical protein
MRIEPFFAISARAPLTSVFFRFNSTSGVYATRGFSLFDFCGVLKRDFDLTSDLLGNSIVHLEQYQLVLDHPNR